MRNGFVKLNGVSNRLIQKTGFLRGYFPMNPLHGRLAALRRRLRLVALVRGLSLVLILFLGGILLAGLLDWTVDAAPFVRAFLLVGILGGTLFCSYQLLWRPMKSRMDDLSLAIRVEDEYPVLNDALASTVQLLQQPEDSPTAGSPAMRKETVQRALRLAQGCDFNKTVNARWLRTVSATATLIAALVVLVCVLSPALALAAFLRLVHPFDEHEWPRETQLALDYRGKIAKGQSFEIRGIVSGKIPDGEKARIEFKNLNSGQEQDTYPISQSSDGEWKFEAKPNVTRQINDFYFRVTVNDASSPHKEDRWHHVQVLEPPHLALLDDQESPQLVLHFPEYTQLPTPFPLAPGLGNIHDALAGTWVDLRAATDRPIVKAWIEFRPEKGWVKQAAMLGAMGQGSSLETLSVYLGGREVHEKVHATIDGSGKRFALQFQPWVKGVYALHIEDAEELPNEYLFKLGIEQDGIPEIQWIKPLTNDEAEAYDRGKSEDLYRPLELLPDAELPMEFLVYDQPFGIESAYVLYYRLDKLGNALDLVPQKMYLYQQGEQPDPTERVRQLKLESRLSIKGLVKVGESLVVQGCAHDFNNVVAFNHPGKTAPIRWLIVSESVFQAKDDEAFKTIRNELLEAKKDQAKVIKNVLELIQAKKADGNLSADDVKKLAKTKALQEDLNNRVGLTSDKGMQGNIKKLLQKYQENKKNLSPAKDRAVVLQKSLERVSRENLKRIEELLSNALNQPDNPKAKPEEVKQAEDLEAAQEHQKEAHDTFADLLQYLEPWAKSQEIRGELQAMLKEQKDLQGQTEKLKQEIPKNNPDWKTKLNQAAELQRFLGEQAEKVLKTIERVSEEKKNTDPKTSEKLKEAAKIGKELDLADMIKDLPKQIKQAAPEGVKRNDPKMQEAILNRAITQQGDTVKALEKMIDALNEDRQEQILERLEKQQKKEKELDEVLEKLQKLQKKVEEAKNLGNPEQQKKALQDLAQEQRDLEEEAKKKSRELAQLNADKAAEEMHQAAQEMNKAAKKLDQGNAPDAEQQAAEKKLKNAEAKLKEAEDQLEEELLRQRLTKIAEKIEGLRDRQEAAIQESERIHEVVMKSGWRSNIKDVMRETLSTHSDVQRGLGAETRQLAVTVKQAKVFEMILSKAAKNMEQASDQMIERIDKAKTRFEFPFPKEQLLDEKKSQELTLEYQKGAKDRLERLIVALKAEIEASEKRSAKAEQGDDGGDGEEPKQKKGIKAQDGIPALAQLKALRDEQFVVNNETREFHELHPDPAVLTPEEQVQINQLRAEQDALFQLFREIAAAAAAAENQAERQENKQGPKQGEKQ
jgi:hypothetical protein